MAYDTDKPFMRRADADVPDAAFPPPAAPSLSDRIANLDKMIEDWWARHLDYSSQAPIRGALDLYALRDRLRAEGLHARMQAIAEHHAEMIAGTQPEITAAMVDRASNLLEHELLRYVGAGREDYLRRVAEEMLKAALVSK